MAYLLYFDQPRPLDKVFLILVTVSTQGTHKSTPRAHKTPTLTAASPQEKKRKQSARETSSLRKSLKVTIRQNKQSTTLIPPSNDDRERDEITKATLLSFTLYKPVLAAEAQENIAKVQEKLAEEETINMVEGEKDEESYTSEFADSMLNDDVDDFGTRIEPESHKENLKVDDNDDFIKKKDDEKNKDEVKDDDVEKTDDAAEEKDIDDHTDHTLVEIHSTANTTLNLYPTTTSSTIDISTTDLQHQLYLNMKSKPQDQAADPELWEILKSKFEKP
nr:hypothetical protein [Tanacetum cinerariifolium]